MTTTLEELEKLPVAERVQLVEDLWDSIARNAAELPVPQWQKDELARRKARHAANSGPVQAWDDVKAELLRRR